ncbi:succinylglutamate-semialdehyde dehydrogenase [Poriferisphaera sp. WC338]|uniref:succinylglutamate-semialdehyde dehydrogenase n=1 Tax=Poriferisphaera sp. WC338 TaxID=3425129 RepID=UPI003D8164AD
MTHYCNNQWFDGDGSTFSSTAPYEQSVIWTGENATESEVDRTVSAARAAFPAWADLSIDARLTFIQTYKTQLEENRLHLARTIAQETGKPLWESDQEVGAMIGKVQLSLDASNERLGEQSLPVGDATGITRYKPYGVCAVFGPFNLPGHLPNGHIIPALLAGNTIVLKPSEKTPLVAQEMIKLWHNANLPTGVINMTQGDASTGKALALHPNIDAVFFTGSYNVGRAINKMLADHPEKIIALEMGGNNPLIVHETADLDAAVYMTILSGYITAGQRCTCARRLIVPQTSQGDDFIEKLTVQIRKITAGKWDAEPQPFIGTLIDKKAAESLLNTQQNMINRGARSLLSMHQLDGSPALLSPGLIDTTHMTDPVDEEWFGPLMQLKRVPNFDAAIEEANQTSFGLSAALLSDSQEHYNNFFSKIRAGIVNWNRQTTGASGRLAFGGCGKSGNGRPAGFYSADYCAFPVASLEATALQMPDKPIIGTGY